MNKKSIVITGCSSGFGRITALEFAERGWHVFGTVRKEADREHVLADAATRNARENLTIVLCDITQSEQVMQLFHTVEDTLRRETSPPRLDALLNNAGTAYAGPLELLPLEELRAQFEVNVVAHLGVIQTFLPLLRAAKGTIINVSSINGRFAAPIIGAYAASKFALEGLSDALRLELAPFGVHVVVIEPDSSPTNIWMTSLQRSNAHLDPHRNGPYARLLMTTEKLAARFRTRGFPTQLFATTIVQILDSSHPRTRYVVPRKTALLVQLHHFLPDHLWDRLLRLFIHW